MAMVAVAIFAGVTAEMVYRRTRLARLSIAHHERAYAYFNRVGRTRKFGEAPASIETSSKRYKDGGFSDRAGGWSWG
jgi:hypothetical protein